MRKGAHITTSTCTKSSSRKTEGEATAQNAQGQKTHTEFSGKLDGKDYPITGAPNWDSLAIRKIDNLTFQFTYKKAGNVVRLAKRTVSNDGKSMSTAIVGVNPGGVFSHDVIVYDRQ